MTYRCFTRCLASLLLTLLAGCTPGGLLIKPVSLQQGLEETVIQRDQGLWVNDKIAIINVDGVIANKAQGWGLFGSGENPVALFQEKLDFAKKDANVKAIVLRINSPGGTVAASDVMYHLLARFKQDTGKPVIASILDLGASGAYYLACGADGIIAQPTSVTGSIGVIFQTVSVAGTMEKIGVSAVAIKSGQLKDMASPLTRLRPKARQVLTGIVMDFYDRFLQVVEDGRGNLSRDQIVPLADGRVYTASQALEQGLIDRIGYPTDAVAWAKELAHVQRAKTVIYHRDINYTPNIYAGAQAQSNASLIDLKLPEWLRAQGPQFLYLWQPDPLNASD